MGEYEDQRKERFIKFLNQKYLEFVQARGRVTSLKKFANYAGVSPTSMSQYMSGDRIPDNKNANRMAMALGTELFTILGMKPTGDNDDMLGYLIDWWRSANPKQRDALVKAATKIRER